MADAGEHILQVAPGLLVIEHLGRGDQRQAVALGTGPQSGFLHRFVGAPVARNHGVEPVAKGVA